VQLTGIIIASSKQARRASGGHYKTEIKRRERRLSSNSQGARRRGVQPMTSSFKIAGELIIAGGVNRKTLKWRTRKSRATINCAINDGGIGAWETVKMAPWLKRAINVASSGAA